MLYVSRIYLAMILHSKLSPYYLISILLFPKFIKLQTRIQLRSGTEHLPDLDRRRDKGQQNQVLDTRLV